MRACRRAPGSPRLRGEGRTLYNEDQDWWQKRRIDPGDAHRSVRQRRSHVKMPRRNAHADAAPSENEALNDGQTQELQVNSAVNGSNFSMMGENELVNSSNASQYLGERIPTNTMYNTGTGIKAFARFVGERPSSKSLKQLFKFLLPSRKKPEILL